MSCGESPEADSAKPDLSPCGNRDESVFVVTEGAGSDYHIEAVRSLRKLAKKYVERNKGRPNTSHWDIAEWEVDHLADLD